MGTQLDDWNLKDFNDQITLEVSKSTLSRGRNKTFNIVSNFFKQRENYVIKDSKDNKKNYESNT